jgi:hypothetical protein
VLIGLFFSVEAHVQRLLSADLCSVVSSKNLQIEKESVEESISRSSSNVSMEGGGLQGSVVRALRR